MLVVTRQLQTPLLKGPITFAQNAGVLDQEETLLGQGCAHLIGKEMCRGG